MVKCSQELFLTKCLDLFLIIIYLQRFILISNLVIPASIDCYQFLTRFINFLLMTYFIFVIHDITVFSKELKQDLKKIHWLGFSMEDYFSFRFLNKLYLVRKLKKHSSSSTISEWDKRSPRHCNSKSSPPNSV